MCHLLIGPKDAKRHSKAHILTYLESLLWIHTFLLNTEWDRLLIIFYVDSVLCDAAKALTLKYRTQNSNSTDYQIRVSL